MKRSEMVLFALGCLTLGSCEWWHGADPKKGDCPRLKAGESLSLDGKCFRVSGDLTVGSGDSVVVPEGTELRFDEGARLRVQAGGRFVSAGNAANPVRIGPANAGDAAGSGTGGCWGGLVFEPGSAGALQSTIVSGGGFAASTKEGCVCGGAGACVTIAGDAQVSLQQVGFEKCATEGVAGVPASAGQVGCSALGMCTPDAEDKCVFGGSGDVNAWCPEEDVSKCWDPDAKDEGAKECEIADRRCDKDQFVQGCVGGKWTTITDCGELTNGQTACRSYGGFPRCGLPGPSECLALPEQPGGSFIPGCDVEGCPAYRAACRGDKEAKSCEAKFEVGGCLHPNLLSGPASYTGLGPHWLRLILYNWGGLPDTTQGSVALSLEGGSEYILRVWVPPRKKYERNFWGMLAGDGLPNARLAMPPPGEQYEVLVEVGSYRGPKPGAKQTKTIALVPTASRWWDEEAVVWREYGGGDSYYARCNLVSEAKSFIGEYEDDVDDFFTDVCVDSEGRFVRGDKGEVVEGFPDLGAYPPHADGKLTDCDTWELVVEYSDEAEEMP